MFVFYRIDTHTNLNNLKKGKTLIHKKRKQKRYQVNMILFLKRAILYTYILYCKSLKLGLELYFTCIQYINRDTAHLNLIIPSIYRNFFRMITFLGI